MITFQLAGFMNNEIGNTHSSPKTPLDEEYQTLSMTAQFSLENELSKSSIHIAILISMLAVEVL